VRVHPKRRSQTEPCASLRSRPTQSLFTNRAPVLRLMGRMRGPTEVVSLLGDPVTTSSLHRFIQAGVAQVVTKRLGTALFKRKRPRSTTRRCWSIGSGLLRATCHRVMWVPSALSRSSASGVNWRTGKNSLSGITVSERRKCSNGTSPNQARTAIRIRKLDCSCCQTPRVIPPS
jgi:hypothetical protein